MIDNRLSRAESMKVSPKDFLSFCNCEYIDVIHMKE